MKESARVSSAGQLHAVEEAVRGEARAWFEQHEPSSPVAVLLKQAECLVGKRYAEVASAIPAELLAQWDGESDQPV